MYVYTCVCIRVTDELKPDGAGYEGEWRDDEVCLYACIDVCMYVYMCVYKFGGLAMREDVA